MSNKVAEAQYAEGEKAMPIVVLGNRAFKNRLKAEAAGNGKGLAEYTRKLIDLGRKAVEANPALIKEA